MEQAAVDERSANENGNASDCVVEQVTACDFENENDSFAEKHESATESEKSFAEYDACSNDRYDSLDVVVSGWNPLCII